MVDLAASEHAYGQVMKALYRRASTGKGCRIDVGMFQSAVSFMVNPIMLTESFGEEITRRGNTHQFFAPVSVYPTRDGHLYLAVGNDRQWEALTSLPGFEGLADPAYERNAGRIADVDHLNERIGAVTAGMTTTEALEVFGSVHIPAARVNTIHEVAADPIVKEGLLRSKDPATGTEVVTAPPVVETEFLRGCKGGLPFAPRLGEHNAEIYGEVGLDAGRLADLKAKGIV
jgi:formyl-CoA transferase